MINPHCYRLLIIAIDESFLSLTFPETNLKLKVQNHKDFLRVHYLAKRFHLLLLERGADCFQKKDISKEINEWEKDNIMNKDFNIRVVNMFCWELFEEQSDEYKEKIYELLTQQKEYNIAKKYGVEFKFNEAVTKINVEGKIATKIITKNHEDKADLVINNADYHHGETQLLDEKHQTYKSNYWKKKTMAVSMHLAYIGVKRKINSLTHHNYFFNENWNEHFDQVFKTPEWPDNPNFYVCCPSKIDNGVAPKGMENLFFLVPVACDLEDSDEIREQYFDKVLEKFENETGEKIKDDIVVKSLFTHRDFKERYNAYKGTGLGMAHTLWQTAVFRPKHKSSKVSNLYYTGQYNHPGVGVPTTVISSQILVDELNKKGVLT